MDQQLRRELQIRARVEGIFNKRESDFEDKREYNDYLEEREDIIFNLTEGIDVKENEARVEAYRAANADSIAANEAARAEEVRAAAARELVAHDLGPEVATVSGTAAAFQGGRDAEPHQGTEYTAAMPSGFLAQQRVPGQGLPAPVPEATNRIKDGDIAHAPPGTQGKKEWEAMALASGWTPELSKGRCREEAYGTVLVF